MGSRDQPAPPPPLGSADVGATQATWGLGLDDTLSVPIESTIRADAGQVGHADHTSHAGHTGHADHTGRAGHAGVTGGEAWGPPVSIDLSQPLSSAPPSPGDGALIGMGAMGEVRAHRDVRIGREVALKSLRDAGDEQGRVRFVREARVQGQLEHPSIVPVYNLGVDADGKPFFTMKRVRGETLAHVLRQLAAGDESYVARYSRARLLSDFARVCLALEYAHERGVVHRDLKPQNIMLGAFGETYVLDWGVAKLLAGADIDDVAPTGAPLGDTSVGAVVGTPLYMAPEQLLGRRSQVGPRSDVYALGAMLFEILTLEPLRRGESLVTLVAALHAPVERPSQRAKARTLTVPAALDDLCARALEPDPDQRLASAKQLAEGVERVLDGDRSTADRAAQAAALITEARAALDRPAASDAEARVTAMRAALRALALAPESVEAQKLLLSLVVDGSGSLPREAEDELARTDEQLRERGARVGRWAFSTWLLLVPIALWVGVRSWAVIGAQIVLTLVCIAVTALIVRFRWGLRSSAASLMVAALCTVVTLVLSGWLGPFVLVPTVVAGFGIYFIAHATRDEARLHVVLWSLVGLAAFALEGAGVFPSAYDFVGGDIVLHARALDLPRGPTTFALVYTSVVFTFSLCTLIANLRSQQRATERKLFVQAWHLRKLFPHEPPPSHDPLA